MKICFAISSLSSGGAERVSATTANYWAEKGNNITIVLTAGKGSFYRINENVTIIELGMNGENKKKGKLFSLLYYIKTITSLRTALKEIKPDIVISFITQINVFSIFAAKTLSLPIIISERSNPEKEIASLFFRILRKITYKYANTIVVQTKNVQRYYKKQWHLTSSVIENPLKNIEVLNKEKENIVLAVGRLGFEKGLDRLIKAFAMIDQQDWKLIIVGEGKERNSLEKLIIELHLEDTILLPGRTKNVGEYYSKASLFVLPSRYEGFPNALCEAMAYGLPCISFNCMSGPSDIIEDGINGLLVEEGNIEKLSQAMTNLISDEKKREKIALEALKIKERLNGDVVMSKWDSLITTTINSQGVKI